MSDAKSKRFNVHGDAIRPHRAHWLAAICGLLIVGSADAQGTTRGLTGGLESGTELVNLPSSPRGSLTASECRGCPTMRLNFDENTRYFIGKEQVPYAKLLEAASKGDIRLYVSYRLGTRTLTRLRLAATGN